MPVVRRFPTAEAPPATLEAVWRLVGAAFDGAFTPEDWAHTLGGWHVVVEEHGEIRSHAAVVPRVLQVAQRPFRAGYVEGVATHPQHQRRGLALVVMRDVSALIRERFELGALSTGAHRLYEKAGWERWRGPTLVRTGSATIRTPEDDDGVMVLRFGPSRSVDLSAPLSCDARAGDDW